MCLFAIKIVVNEAKATAVTELSGIRRAEIMGVNNPEAANEMPMMLYMNEMMNPAFTILIAVWLKLIKSGNCQNLSESRIPSQAGEK